MLSRLVLTVQNVPTMLTGSLTETLAMSIMLAGVLTETLVAQAMSTMLAGVLTETPRETLAMCTMLTWALVRTFGTGVSQSGFTLSVV